MDFTQVADGLFPAWCMGFWMMYLVWNSDHRDLLKISKEGLINFAQFLGIITVGRLFYLSVIAPDEVLEGIRRATDMMQWQTMFGVYWEDMCNTIPLVILARMIEGKKWLQLPYILLMTIMSLTFGALHSYEGLQAVALMSLYIPFTITLGKKYGFGTVMIGHIVYDLLTYFTFSIVSGQ